MTTLRFAHWRDAAGPDWGWPFFSPAEMACSGSGALIVTTTLLDLLVKMRLEWGVMEVTSGHRSIDYNRQVGGVENSEHTTGEAADIAVPFFKQDRFVRLAETHRVPRIGIYPDRGFIHLGVRPVTREYQRRWTKRGRR